MSEASELAAMVEACRNLRSLADACVDRLLALRPAEEPEPKLNACVCGSELVVFDRSGDLWAAWCRKCDRVGPMVGTKESAADYWNRRLGVANRADTGRPKPTISPPSPKPWALVRKPGLLAPEPCVFCMRQPAHVACYAINGASEPLYFVACGNCEARGSWTASPETAIERWNRVAKEAAAGQPTRPLPRNPETEECPTLCPKCRKSIAVGVYASGGGDYRAHCWLCNEWGPIRPSQWWALADWPRERA